jgi:NAD-dependent SIR2 family protein deacetylase
MPQVFHPSTNTISRVSIFGALFFLIAFLAVIAALDRSSYWTRETLVREQPVPFSHDHHVAALGIDCRYCHTSVENAAFAGIPPTATCMNCHSQIWADSPMLEPVRESFRSGQPIRWVRVHDLPDFVYFDHSIHVQKGIGCVECHGRVDRMPLIARTESMQMEWCLRCHRDPVKRLRPRSEIFNMSWREPQNADELRDNLAREYSVASMTDCTTCHR